MTATLNVMFYDLETKEDVNATIRVNGQALELVGNIKREPHRGGASFSVAHAHLPKTTGGCGGCGEKKRSAADLAKGVTGIVKAEFARLGLGAADPDTVRARKATCSACPTGKYDFGVCNGCGCYLAAKVRVRSEACPDGHW